MGYVIEKNTLSYLELRKLMLLNGLNVQLPDQMREAVGKSIATFSVRSENETEPAGCARLLGDGSTVFIVQDFLVRPDFKEKEELKTQLLAYIEEYVASVMEKDWSAQLRITVPPEEDWPEGIGYKKVMSGSTEKCCEIRIFGKKSIRTDARPFYPRCASDDEMSPEERERTMTVYAGPESISMVRADINSMMMVYAGPMSINNSFTFNNQVNMPNNSSASTNTETTRNDSFVSQNSSASAFTETLENNSSVSQNRSSLTNTEAQESDGSRYICELCGTVFLSPHKFCENCGGIVKKN